VAKRVLHGDPLCPPIVPDVGGEVAGERCIQPQTTGLHELQYNEGEDWLAQGRCAEDRMLVDKARRPGKSNALTHIAIELAVTDRGYGDAGHIAGGHEATQQGVINAHDVSMADGAFRFHGSSSRAGSRLIVDPASTCMNAPPPAWVNLRLAPLRMVVSDGSFPRLWTLADLRVSEKMPDVPNLRVERSERFYGEILGLELVLNQGLARIYRVGSGNAFLGICLSSEVQQAPPPDRPVAQEGGVEQLSRRKVRRWCGSGP
jgi:hypothetical protein